MAQLITWQCRKCGVIVRHSTKPTDTSISKCSASSNGRHDWKNRDKD